MPKKNQNEDLIANSMSETLESDDFKRIFSKLKTEPSVSESVTGLNAIERFAKKTKKEEKPKEESDEDSEEDDKDDKKDKKKDSKKDKKDKKDPKNNFKNFFFNKFKKKDKKDKVKKASSKCDCPDDCSCKEGNHCGCECEDCGACGDAMYADAINYVVNSLIKTSEALENMGLVKGSLATLAALDHIIEEAAIQKFASDENDIRNTDLLLGLEDEEALEGYIDEETDDPASSVALEEILKEHPELTNQLITGLKDKFHANPNKDVEDQLKNRIQTRIQEIVDMDEGDTEVPSITEFPPETDVVIPGPPPLPTGGGKETVPAIPAAIPVNVDETIPPVSEDPPTLRKMNPFDAYESDYPRPTLHSEKDVLNVNDEIVNAFNEVNKLLKISAPAYNHDFEDFDDDNNIDEEDLKGIKTLGKKDGFSFGKKSDELTEDVITEFVFKKRKLEKNKDIMAYLNAFKQGYHEQKNS